MKDITAIVLAAGEGTRMKSVEPKVLHKVGGEPMLKCMLGLLRQVGVDKYIVVVGHKAEQVERVLKSFGCKIRTVVQPKLLGSADAVWQARDLFSNFKGDVLIVYGDTPLITPSSLKKLLQSHKAKGADCTILTAVTKDPTGFGRIIRGENERIVKIIEEQDADRYEKAIGEVNVGAYSFKAQELFSVLEGIKPDNAKKEYYLTDTIESLSKKKARIESVCADEEEEALGVNSRSDLSRANAIINRRNMEKLAGKGVTIIDPATTFIYGDVEIAIDTVIYPHCVIEGAIKIGKNCSIGPFAHLRSGTVLEDAVEIGNFVEVVRSRIGSGCKVKHHSYIGDTVMGRGVNVGCGSITANYDGKNKNRTVIGEGAFIGVGTILIAPVKIGKKAVIGAGSVVTKNKDVPAGVTVAGVPATILKKRKCKL